MQICPCGSQKQYLECCGIYITGKGLPETPEALMRSRYTAYTQANIDYIVETMRGPAAQGFDYEDAQNWAKNVIWNGLDVIKSHTQLPYGWVEFIAHFSDQGENQDIHELSEFHFEKGRWFYVERKNPATKRIPTKIGRNDPCSCGSQKKYKKCCGA